MMLISWKNSIAGNSSGGWAALELGKAGPEGFLLRAAVPPEARGGRVVRSGYDPVLYGNFVIVRGDHTRRDYWYSHLKNRVRPRVGDRVRTGQRIGSIGATGNARTIGCHLHFETHENGHKVNPRNWL